jgi:putative salt-induced outer membrane protein YdiY
VPARPAIAALLLTLTLLGPVAGQGEFPIEVPRPMGGPIVGPNGKIMTGLDKPKSPWMGGVEFGLNGSEGNVDILKLRGGVDVRYDDGDNLFLLNALYVFTHHDDEMIEQKGLLTARDELAIADRWAWYAQGTLEYDEFRNVNFRVAAHNGLSLTAMRNPGTVLRLRAGLGTEREFGGDSNDWAPEGQFGADYELRLTKRTSLVAAGDYYPRLDNFRHFRVRGRVSLDMQVDPELNLFIRVGAMERYDSDPFGSRKSDLDYFTTLMLRF